MLPFFFSLRYDRVAFNQRNEEKDRILNRILQSLIYILGLIIHRYTYPSMAFIMTSIDFSGVSWLACFYDTVDKASSLQATEKTSMSSRINHMEACSYTKKTMGECGETPLRPFGFGPSPPSLPGADQTKPFNLVQNKAMSVRGLH